MKKLLYSLTAILFALAAFTACSSSSDDGPTPPPTIDDVQTGIIGKWASPEMELTFRANNTMHIKHGELRRDIDGGEFYVNERDYTTTYTISESEDLVEIFFNGEYMYIHKLANGILSIELYGEDIFFTLAKTNDDTKDEDDENILIEECGDCDGEGYYTYQCYNCFGQGKVRKYTGRCPYCDGKGDNCFRCDYGLAYEYVDCQVCDDGYCKDVCGECKGEGQIIINLIPCPDCDGDGMQDADCHDCDGNGYTEDYSYQCLVCCGMWKSECDKCWGDGLLDYDETTGKNTICNNCYGKGYIVCWHCNGPSKITCETCKGSGKGGKWCTTCYGKGKVRK